MVTVVRVLPAPLERIGALLERRIAAESDWVLGPVERELGEVEAQQRAGLGRAPSRLRFTLTTEPGATTRVSVDLLSKSRWTSATRCSERIEALLDGLVDAAG